MNKSQCGTLRDTKCQNYQNNFPSTSAKNATSTNSPIDSHDDLSNFQDTQMPFEDHDLRDYELSRDRVRREVRPPTRYAHANIIAYALNIGDSIELDEPISYK